jgi:Spy/CpxP family protein refolding chaperone
MLGLATAAGVVLAAAVPAFGQGWGRGPAPGEHHGRMMDMIVERLELTEDQQAQVEALMEQRHEAMEDRLDQLRDARQSLNQAIHAAEFDETVIRDAAAVVAAIEADLAVERAQGNQEFRSILTPDQRTQLDEMQAMMLELGMGRGKGPGPHGGRHR